MILAAHVGTQDLGNIDAAVGVQVVLEERDEHTRGSDDGVVERVGEIELAVLAADADLQSARLRVAEIRAGAYLKVLLLRGLHASISQLLTLRSARSPEQHSS